MIDGICESCSEYEPDHELQEPDYADCEEEEEPDEIQHSVISEEEVSQNDICSQNRNNLSCDNCGRSNFLSVGELKWHKTNLLCTRSRQKATRSNYMTQCNICEKQVIKVLLEKHQATVHKMYKYRCDICFSDFPNREDLTAHKTKAHPKRAEKLTCDKCGKQFDMRYQLKKHIKVVHDKIRDQQCHLCEKNFKTKDVLREHISSVHYGTKHICDLCGRSYNRRSDLTVHVKVRHKEDTKRHTCEQCGKNFEFAKSLKKHMNSFHLGLKLGKCPICHMEFSQQQRVKYHIKLVHEKQKPYECTECQQCFTKRLFLRNHVKSHHPGVDAEKMKAKWI